jgi:hypothetical protein
MIVKQTGTFKRYVKKMYQLEKEALDEAIQQIISDPSTGEMKVSDLAVIQVFKYKHKVQLYSLAHAYLEKELVLALIGQRTPENFYRELKIF